MTVSEQIGDANAWPTAGRRVDLRTTLSNLLFSTRFVTIWIAMAVLLVVCRIIAPSTMSSASWATLLPLGSVVAIVAFSPLAIWDLVSFDWAAPTGSEWVGALWWGAGTMALGSVLWFMGNRDVSGTTASVFMGVMPVSALVLSYVLLGEPFEWVHLLGMVTVLAGLVITSVAGEGHGH